MHSRFYRDGEDDIDEFLSQFDDLEGVDFETTQRLKSKDSSGSGSHRGGSAAGEETARTDGPLDELGSMFEKAGVSLSDDSHAGPEKKPEDYQKINDEFDRISSMFEKKKAASRPEAEQPAHRTASAKSQLPSQKPETSAQKPEASSQKARASSQNSHVPSPKSAAPKLPSEEAKTDRPPFTEQQKESTPKRGTSKADPWASKEEAAPDFWSSGAKSGKSEEGTQKSMKTKKKKKKKGKGGRGRKILKIILSLFAAGIIACCALVGSIILTTDPINPDNIYEKLTQNSVILADDGQVVDNLGSELRTNVSYNQLPKNLVNAVIAIEDKTFWEHHGFNFVRMFGAVLEGITKGESIGGTSTITQQLARNLYLEDSKSQRSIKRKIKEAYYAVQLEQSLSKQQIIEAYLNTIYLGGSSYGVEAASKSYFNKDVWDLNLAECALLASIPKNPTKNSPVKRAYTDIDTTNLDVLSHDDATNETIWYDDRYIPRQHQVLKNMLDQGMITKADYDDAMNFDIRAAINPSQDVSTNLSSYFIDYVVSQVKSDLINNRGMDEDSARNLIDNGGLQIHTTMNLKSQQIVEDAFKESGNFPTVANLKKDRAGNILDSNGKILVYAQSNMLDSNGTFHMNSSEYRSNADGSLTLLPGNRLNFYKTTSNGQNDVSIEFKNMYRWDDKIFKTRQGGVINIESKYKTKNDDGSLTISADFFQKFPDVFQQEHNGMAVSSQHYTLRQEVAQPQAAMVIMDYKTGSIKAMVGGRNLKGQRLFNRAISPRQPGSSIKPIGVYGPAFQSSIDAAKTGDGTVWTAASVARDEPQSTVNGKPWPKNWYKGYKPGPLSLRYAIEQSINTIAVHVWNDVGPEKSVKFLKGLGVSSVVEDGSTNDLNPAALALGGMTKGISPLEMCAAYSAFPDGGVYTTPIAYTQVMDRKGNIILESKSKTSQAMDPGVAYLITDILRTAVANGGGKAANFSTQPVAGKTGTTTDQFDAWFVGFTPQYSASLWLGNDLQIELSSGSTSAARLWGKIMKQVTAGADYGAYSKPSDIISVAIDPTTGMLPSEYSQLSGRVKNEYFIKGTEPKEAGHTDSVTLLIDPETGELATPSCPNPVSVTYGSGGTADNPNPPLSAAPKYYCHLHNPDPTKYPIDPKYSQENPPSALPDNSQGTDGGNSNPSGEGYPGVPAPTPNTPGAGNSNGGNSGSNGSNSGNNGNNSGNSGSNSGNNGSNSGNSGSNGNSHNSGGSGGTTAPPTTAPPAPPVTVPPAPPVNTGPVDPTGPNF